MKIFITGSTGFLGGELLVNLSKYDFIEKIYCLVRAKSKTDAENRIKKIFSVHSDKYDSKKIIPIIGNIADFEFSEQLKSNPILKDINYVIHSAANTSFSPIYNDLIEKVNINGLNEILNWACNLTKLEKFVYIGTATISGKDITDRIIFEDESPNLLAKHLVKYTETKMRGELMLEEYLPNNKTLVVRPSIVMGDSRGWIPRSYVIMWALATLNQLRLLPLNPNSKLDIVPVDFVANSICKLVFNKNKYNVYHISSGFDSHTTPKKVTDAISKYFENKPHFKYVPKQLISQMKLWSKDKLKSGSELFSHQEYLDYWEKEFSEKSKLRIIFAGLEPYVDFIELGQIFDNTRLFEELDIEKPQPAHEYILNQISYLKEINVFDGALDP